ncbi:WXG100 family type VII secretion target [Micromonospora echinofusca]|uniref:PPE family protein n=1 Tax=Micromonospora echinofusca TaxID=47858 RepID=A0ABS3VSE0_MICEH|nr:hypothetical protein [Micromonospora echinofusca]MBO4207304.1 hypothetical protein [Micromonospora echinofusca]
MSGETPAQPAGTKAATATTPEAMDWRQIQTALIGSSFSSEQDKRGGQGWDHLTDVAQGTHGNPMSLFSAGQQFRVLGQQLSDVREQLNSRRKELVDSGRWSGEASSSFEHAARQLDSTVRSGVKPLTGANSYPDLLYRAATALQTGQQEIVALNLEGALWTKQRYDYLASVYMAGRRGPRPVEPWFMQGGKAIYTPSTYPDIDQKMTQRAREIMLAVIRTYRIVTSDLRPPSGLAAPAFSPGSPLPGINLPGAPGLPAAPDIGGLSGLAPGAGGAGVPGMPGSMDLPESPGLPGAGGSGSSGAPAMPEMPDLPESPAIPGLDGIGGDGTGAPGSGGLPGTGGTPALPTLPVSPPLPGLGGVPNSTGSGSRPGGTGSIPSLPGLSSGGGSGGGGGGSVPRLPSSPAVSPTFPAAGDGPPGGVKAAGSAGVLPGDIPPVRPGGPTANMVTGAGVTDGTGRMGPYGGMPMMPPMMPPGAGGNGQDERERATWLVEDRDIWSVTETVGPGVVTGGTVQPDDETTYVVNPGERGYGGTPRGTGTSHRQQSSY